MIYQEGEFTAQSPDQKRIEGGAYELYQRFAVEAARFFARRLENANFNTKFPLRENMKWRYIP